MLKDLMQKMEKLEAENDIWDRYMDANPMNDDICEAWDKAYEKYYKAHLAVVDYIVKLTGIEKATAQTMVGKYRSRLWEIARMEG